MNVRKMFVFIIPFFVVFLAVLSHNVSFAVTVDTAMEGACKSSGGQCSSGVQCPSGWNPTVLTCTRVNPIIPCCIKKDSPCESAGNTCSRQSPGQDYVELSLSCSETEQKCWKESSATSDCGGPCVVPTQSCPSGTHPVAKQCPAGTRCCENDATMEKCTPSGGSCGGDCGRCSICRLKDNVYQCVYSKDSCSGCGGAIDDTPRGKFNDLFYSGPIIKNIESILVPLGKILYYGGLFIGMAFIVVAGYTLMTSEGNPQKTQEGQEQLTAAILGIAFILLSSAILRVIISLV